MRVTIEHREEAAGVSGTKRNYVIDCRVEFSEEEKAIIQARDLRDHIVMDAHLRPPPLPVLETQAFSMGSAGGVLVLGAIVLVILAITSGVGASLIFPVLIVGVVFMLFGNAAVKKQQETPWEPEPIRVKKLMEPHSVLLYAIDPARAKAIDGEFREGLVSLKQLIAASAELRGKETFEL